VGARAVGEAVVVRDDRVETAGAGDTERRDEVDGVERGDGGGRDGLSGGEQVGVERKERDTREELVCVGEPPHTKREPAKLDAEQPARHPSLEAGDLAQDRRGIRFAEQDPAERAGVQIGDGQRPRSSRLSARYASVVPAGAPGGERRAAMASSGSTGTVAPN
jgi:hypothetical protein